MTSPSVVIDATFNRPRDATAILFLIEDSSNMANLWQCLKAHYIKPLLHAITVANPSTAAEALWMTAAQFKPQSDNATHGTPHWDDIPFINFTQSETLISPNNVSHAIEALSATFGRRSATRHLVIIATVDPPAGTLGHRKNLAWSTTVERLHQEEIWVHLIVRSQVEMDGLTPLYWDLIGKGRAHESFADDTKFVVYLCDFHDTIGKGKASATDNRRVPNSGSQSTSSASSIDKPGLVYQLQKMNGMEKKRRSKVRRDQPAINKPGQPYQKNHPHTRASSSTNQPASLDPSNRSPSRRKGTLCVSNVEEARDISPPRASLSIPMPPFNPFQHMALASHSTPDSLFPTSPSWNPYAPRLACDLPEQASTTSSLPPMSHILDTTSAGNPSGSYLYLDYGDHATGTSIQNTHLFDRSPDAGSLTTAPYYS